MNEGKAARRARDEGPVMVEKAPRTRRYDPDRKMRIARAVIEVVAREGIGSLSTRKVAAAADVPLGSLAYYFTSKEEMLQTAMTLAREEASAFVRDLTLSFEPEKDLARALGHTISALTTSERERFLLDYEWIFATGMQSVFAEQNRVWTKDGFAVWRDLTDERTAELITHMFYGMLFNSAVFGKRYTPEEASEGFARLLP